MPVLQRPLTAKIAFITLLILGIPQTSFALIVTGSIYEYRSQAPLAGIPILLQKEYPISGVFSDDTGYFELQVDEQVNKPFAMHISSYNYIGLHLAGLEKIDTDTLDLGRMYLYYPKRKKLPHYATCGTFQLKIRQKKKIPQTLPLYINGVLHSLTLNLKKEHYFIDF